MAEHYPLVFTEKVNIKMTSNRLGSKLENCFFGMHFENLHLEHHLNPAIPYWNLEAARQIRLTNSEYAALPQSGGIFTRSKNGAPTLMEQLFHFNEMR